MKRQAGFTLIEVMVSIVILSIGILAMAASSATITRTLRGSRNATIAAQMATGRLDLLRAASQSTNPLCTSGDFTSSAAAQSSNGVTETWVVPPNGQMRTVRAIVTYRAGRRAKTDTLATNITCK